METDLERYRKTFFTEAAEHLAALESSLLRLESVGGDPAAADDAFRAAHSLKGGADAVGFPRLTRFTHALEEVLDRCRAAGAIPARRLDLLLEATDVLAKLTACARTGADEPPGVDEWLTRLDRERDGDGGPGDGKSWWSAPEELTARLAGPGAAPAPPAEYDVRVVPHGGALRHGLDPLPLLRELIGLGEGRVALDKSRLPPLSEMDPEECYLAWRVSLKTDRAPDQIADVFAFARDAVEVAVEKPPAAGPQPAPAAAPPAPPSGGPSVSMFESAVRRDPAPNPVRLVSFLVGRGAIDAHRGLEALEWHHAERPTLARLAVETGRLPVERAFDIFRRLGDGESFAAAVVDQGALTDADLGRLMLAQERRTPPIHRWLVSTGVVPAADMNRLLAAFRAGDGSACDDGALTQSAEADVPAPPGASIFRDNGAMIADFCAEADEHLEAADRHLLALDADPTNAEALNAIYRGFHTVKGVSSMLGLAAIQTLAHEAENLLNLAREGKLVLRGGALDLAFESNDALKRQVRAVRQWTPQGGPIEPDPALPRLLADLRAAVSGKPAAADKPRPPAPPVAAAAAADDHPAAAEPAGRRPAPAAADKETVRVDKDRLDKLINTIGELVIAQSMAQEEFHELTRHSGGHSRALPELTKIARDLQELSLSLRMVPLSGTFQKMTRLVRDLARKLNKPVELALHGEETELDKTVVDQLGDPLMHMVRNAIDHGLEAPDGRAAAGKPAEGRVALKAYHQGGNVYIELTDDGRGLDRDRILAKAVEKGIVAADARLSDSEVYQLIFAPGFSTAAAVTDVSGRGVGMDVVRRNVEALQGNILIRTQLGKGTTFTIRLPLTLAIMDGLVVGLGEDVYVLPLLSVVESFRPKRSEVRTVGGRGEVVNVRGEVVPLLRTHQLLGRPARETDPCRGLVVLVEDQGRKHALLVDDLLGQMQAVVKSLDANFRRVDGLAGATILGDGRVAMILDIHGLIQLHAQFGGRPAAAAGSELALENL